MTALAAGVIEQVEDGHILRFERHLKQPRQAVWAAFADPDARAAWFFLGQLELALGGKVELVDSAYGITGEVTAIVTGQLLEFSWQSKDAPVESRVRFDLSDETDGTRLVFTHSVDRHARPDNLAYGWRRLLDQLQGSLAVG